MASARGRPAGPSGVLPDADTLARLEGRVCRLLSAIVPQLPYVVLGGGVASSVAGFCRAAGIGLAATLAGGYAAALAAFTLLTPWLGLPTAAWLAAAAVAGVMLPLYLALAAGVPMAVYRSRGSTLEARFLPFAMSLALLLTGGLKVSDALRYMRERLLRDLPEFRIELEYIASNLEMGRPVDAVLIEAARLTPSPSLRALLLSLARAARMGLHAATVVEHSIRTYLSTYAILVEKASTSLGFLFEVYVVLGLVVPIIVGIVALLMAVYPVLGLSVEAVIVASMFALIPLVSVAVLVAADAVMSRLRI